MPYTTLIIVSLIVFLFCLAMLNFSKIKLFFLSLKYNKKPKKKKEKEKIKVKPTENQIRPVLKPPEERKLLNNTQIEGKKQETSVMKKEENFEPNTQKNVSLTQDNLLNFPSRYTTNSNRKFKTKEELDKEFEEIRNFLDLPNVNNKKVNSTTNKTIAMPRVTLNEPSFIKQNENAIKFDENKNFLGNTKPYDNGNNEEKNIIKIDGDEIDLNKLPINLRKLLILDVLSRKNFD